MSVLGTRKKKRVQNTHKSWFVWSNVFNVRLLYSNQWIILIIAFTVNTGLSNDASFRKCLFSSLSFTHSKNAQIIALVNMLETIPHLCDILEADPCLIRPIVILLKSRFRHISPCWYHSAGKKHWEFPLILQWFFCKQHIPFLNSLYFIIADHLLVSFFWGLLEMWNGLDIIAQLLV